MPLANTPLRLGAVCSLSVCMRQAGHGGADRRTFERPSEVAKPSTTRTQPGRLPESETFTWRARRDDRVVIPCTPDVVRSDRNATRRAAKPAAVVAVNVQAPPSLPLEDSLQVVGAPKGDALLDEASKNGVPHVKALGRLTSGAPPAVLRTNPKPEELDALQAELAEIKEQGQRAIDALPR